MKQVIAASVCLSAMLGMSQIANAELASSESLAANCAQQALDAGLESQTDIDAFISECLENSQSESEAAALEIKEANTDNEASGE